MHADIRRYLSVFDTMTPLLARQRRRLEARSPATVLLPTKTHGLLKRNEGLLAGVAHVADARAGTQAYAQPNGRKHDLVALLIADAGPPT